MKRITMIVAIALMVVLSARFDTESQTYKGPATISNLIPEVSKFMTLTDLITNTDIEAIESPMTLA